MLLLCKVVIFPWTQQGALVWVGVFIALASAFAVVELIASMKLNAARRRSAQIEQLISDVDTNVTGSPSDHEDPRSRFFEDPAKRREKLLAPPRGLLGLGGGFLMVMKPYFWPRGAYNKLRTISTFAVMAGSKVCGIYAPLYIGRAVQTLTDEKRVPYFELAMYTGLSFGVQALKQLQNIIYLGVKQQAFAEIAENTFRHLHSLSLDWHLKKKMGAVLRIMDRGI